MKMVPQPRNKPHVFGDVLCGAIQSANLKEYIRNSECLPRSALPTEHHCLDSQEASSLPSHLGEREQR